MALPLHEEQVLILIDVGLFIVPFLGGILTSRFQPSDNEPPSRQLVLMQYAAIGTVLFYLMIQALTFYAVIPRLPIGFLFMLLAFPIGYSTHRVLVAGQRPSREEAVLLGGLIGVFQVTWLLYQVASMLL